VSLGATFWKEVLHNAGGARRTGPGGPRGAPDEHGIRCGEVSTFLSVTGREHEGSELTGATFDPSGRRLYFSSQRAHKTGAI